MDTATTKSMTDFKNFSLRKNKVFFQETRKVDWGTIRNVLKKEGRKKEEGAGPHFLCKNR